MWFRPALSDERLRMDPFVPLYAIQARGGAGTMGVLECGSLVVHTFNGAHGRQEDKVQLELLEDRAPEEGRGGSTWRCLAVVHSRRSLFNRGEVPTARPNINKPVYRN
eukprot:858688-Prorocentrum_minimum.AAC.1